MIFINIKENAKGIGFLLLAMLWSIFPLSSIDAQLMGVKSIPGDYATLASAITDLNTQGVGPGGVTINLLAGNPENAPAGGYIIGGSGSAVLTTSSTMNQIIIQGNGNTITSSPTLTAGALNDAIFNLIGADWVTVSGFTMIENAANTTTTPASNNMTEWGIALLYVVQTDGAQNNTIQNNSITLDRTYANSFGIYSNVRHNATNVTAVADITNNTTAPNSGNKVYGNMIQNVNMAITFIGSANAANMDIGNDIGGTSVASGNTLTNWGGLAAATAYVSNSATSYCVYMNHQAGDNISYNTITSAAVSGAPIALRGIYKNYSSIAPTLVFTSNINYNTITMSSGFAGSPTAFECILVSQFGNTVSMVTVNINYNMIINSTITGAAHSALSCILNAMHCQVLNIDHNTIRGHTSSSIGGFTGIQNTGNVTSAINITNNQVGDEVADAINMSSPSVLGIVSGIYVATAFSTSQTNISNNNFQGIVIQVLLPVQVQLITIGHAFSSQVSNNTFTNLTINTTANFWFIARTGNFFNNTTHSTNNNAVVGTFTKTGASSNFWLYYSQSTAGTNVSETCTENNFSNISLAGTSVFNGFFCNSVVANKTISNNIISNITGGSGEMNILTVSGSTNGTVSGNTISNITSSGNFNALVSISGTQIFTNNTIHSITSTASSGVVIAVSVSGGITQTFSHNTIHSLSATGLSVPTIRAFYLNSSSTTFYIFKNKMYNLFLPGASTVGAIITGIGIVAHAASTIHHNLIGDFRAPAMSSGNPISGISLLPINGSYNVYYNTIYLAGTSTGTNFSTVGISHRADPTVGNGSLDLRNNIIVNLCTPKGTGRVVALSRSTGSGALGNYSINSNNNLFYAGSNPIYYDGTTSYPISAFKALVAPRETASVTEIISPTPGVFFQSLTGADAGFLHIVNGIMTQAESGAENIATFTTDYDLDIRQGNAGYTGIGTDPDMGADEFQGIHIDLMGPSIAYSPIVNTACLLDRELSVTIQDENGVNTTAGTKPRLYFKKSSDANTYAGNTSADNGWKYVEASNTSSPFLFTTNYALLQAPLINGEVIQYFVVAQDLLGTPNIEINTGIFNSPPTSVNLSAGHFPITGAINNYLLIPALSGTVTIGTGGTYTTLSGPTGLFAAINTYGLKGNLIANIISAAITESGTQSLNTIVNQGCNPSIYTLTIKTTVPCTISGNTTGAPIKLNGADNVTIDGSIGSISSSVCPSVSATRDLTITNPNTGAGTAVIWLQSNGTDGATNNVIKNCNIAGNSGTTTLIGIGSGNNGISITSSGANNHNNTFLNNSISKVQYGIYSQGSSGGKNTGNIISKNVLSTASPNNVGKGGILIGFENNITISGNIISNIAQATAVDVFGISLGISANGFSSTVSTGNEVTNALVIKNVIGNIVQSLVLSAVGIGVAPATSGTNLIANNMIYGVAANSTTTNVAAGILLAGGTGSTTQVYGNTVHMQGTITGATAATQTSACLAVTAATPPMLDVRNNIFVNTQAGNTGASTRFVNVALRYTSTAGNYAGLISEYNDFYTAGAGPGSYVTGLTGGVGSDGISRPTLADWTMETGRDGGGTTQVLLPVFMSSSDLHINSGDATNTPLDGAGVMTSLTDDFDCDVRMNDIGADEFTPDFSPPAITYTPIPNSGCATNYLVLATITDPSGINTNPGSKPRLYYKKSTDANTYVGNTSADNGWKYIEAANITSPFNLVFNFALLQSLPSMGDIIDYFVVAQDLAGVTHVAINSGVFNAPPTSVDLLAGNFPITGTINNFIYSGAQSIVMNVNDAGGGSLRDIIGCALDGATITFDNSLTGQTVTLTSGEIAINKNLTLIGPGMLNLTLSGNNVSRIFNLQPGEFLELQGMALKNASSMANGGAVLIDGILKLNDVLLENNMENGIPKALTLTTIGSLFINSTVQIKN